MTQILVFGDCAVYGKWDKEGGWVQRLKKFLDEKHMTYSGKSLALLNDLKTYCFVYSVGVDGNKTPEILERFEFEAEQRIRRGGETIIIFQVGGADSQFVHSQNKCRTLPEDFKGNIEKLIVTAKRFSSKIIFIGVNPVDESRTDPISWATDKSYKNNYVQKYDGIMKSICKENNVYFIEIFDVFVDTDYKKLLEDGLHFNSEGHQKIFEVVKDFLIKNKII